MAISFIGQAAAASTTVAIPAHQAGDLILVFAFKDGTNTIDTMSSPWNIAGQNGSQVSSGTSNVHYQIAASGSTTDPSIADATEMIVLVYRGVDPADPIGDILGDSATGGEVTYPSLGTLEVSDGTSWGVAFAGHRSADTDMADIPAGMVSLRRNLGNTTVAFDTNGGVASVGAGTTAGVTSGLRWCSWQLELRAEVLASAAVTGTATPGIYEANVVAGGKTVIITLTNETWVTAGATFDAIRQDIIDGLDSAQAEGTGWNAEVRDNEVVGAVVRTSNTVVTITLSAAAAYDITAIETITVTVPGSALTGGNPITASPTFTVDEDPVARPPGPQVIRQAAQRAATR